MASRRLYSAARNAAWRSSRCWRRSRSNSTWGGKKMRRGAAQEKRQRRRRGFVKCSPSAHCRRTMVLGETAAPFSARIAASSASRSSSATLAACSIRTRWHGEQRGDGIRGKGGRYGGKKKKPCQAMPLPPPPHLCRIVLELVLDDAGQQVPERKVRPEHRRKHDDAVQPALRKERKEKR